MKKAIIAVMGSLAILALPFRPAGAFPLGFSAVGGIGAGYYGMDELNRHLGLLAQTDGVQIDDLSKGVNIRAEGRVWMWNTIAITGGYERFWGQTDAMGGSSSLSYRAPSDVYTLGVIGVLLRVKNAFDLCAGVNACFAKSVYGTNELVERRLSEFKGDGSGFEAYAEVDSNFLNPIVVGLQLGYRGLGVDTFSDKYGDAGFFEAGRKIEIDYSGVFFYLTTAIRL